MTSIGKSHSVLTVIYFYFYIYSGAFRPGADLNVFSFYVFNWDVVDGLRIAV